MKISGLEISGTSHTQVAVRLKAGIAAPVQLFWSRVGAAGFTVGRSVILNYSTPGAFETLVFDLDGVSEWDGETITGLRLDPLNGAGTSGESSEIDLIEISDGLPCVPVTPDYRFDIAGDFEGWVATKDIDPSYVIGGAAHGVSIGGDPILQRLGADFEASGVESFLIRIRSSASGNLDFFWSTTEASGFNASRKVSVAYTGDGTYQVVRVPLAGHVEWDGKLIEDLRVDPINVSGVDFAIDRIFASDGDGDDDGMPDTYELANGTDPLDALDALLDGDGDGNSNVNEYVAGTDPNDLADRTVLSFTNTPGVSFQVNLPGKMGRSYRLMRKLHLADPGWTEVEGVGLLGADATVFLEDLQTFDRAFYRVEIAFP